MDCATDRRGVLKRVAAAGMGIAAASLTGRLLGDATPQGAKAARSLFDGKSLNGWKPIPRLPVPNDPKLASIPSAQLRDAAIAWYRDRHQQKRIDHVGRWDVVDGAIVGGHEPPESLYGAYLISDQTFADFELDLDARPDWPADTGIMIRTHELGSIGFQVTLDHRPQGSIGGVFGNSIGSFLVAPVVVTGDKQPGFRVANLRPSEPPANRIRVAPTYGATFEQFKSAWHLNDWNHLRIRCVGELPVITTWINGTKICELDTATIQANGYDPKRVRERLGRAGHVAFEVHDINPTSPLGYDRWAIGAVCRWRNISIVEL